MSSDVEFFFPLPSWCGVATESGENCFRFFFFSWVNDLANIVCVECIQRVNMPYGVS